MFKNTTPLFYGLTNGVGINPTIKGEILAPLSNIMASKIFNKRK